MAQFETLLDARPLDLVICDMAPNMSGNAVTDQARSFYEGIIRGVDPEAQVTMEFS